MQTRLSIKAVGNATSLFLAISFVLCVGLSLIIARHLMAQSLQMWLPGFVWLTGPSFVLGLAESYAYGWFIAALWVPLYNAFAGRSSALGSGQPADESVPLRGLKR